MSVLTPDRRHAPANREVEDRMFGVVNVQPEFAAGGAGLEPGR